MGSALSLRIMLAGLVVSFAAACPGDGQGDSRTRTTFDLVIAAEGDPASLSSEHGGTVELTEAKLSIGTIEWFLGDALFATRIDRTQRVIDGLLSFSAARAHPGHYTPGEALADLPAVGVVDLLAGPFAAGTAEGLTGVYGTLSLPFENASELGDAAVKLTGTAHLDDGDVPFSIALPLDKTVEGVPCAVTISGSGTLTLTVSLEDLVRRIDFSELPRDATADLLTIEQGRNSVERSIESQATYTATYDEG